MFKILMYIFSLYFFFFRLKIFSKCFALFCPRTCVVYVYILFLTIPKKLTRFCLWIITWYFRYRKYDIKISLNKRNYYCLDDFCFGYQSFDFFFVLVVILNNWKFVTKRLRETQTVNSEKLSRRSTEFHWSFFEHDNRPETHTKTQRDGTTFKPQVVIN